RGAAATDGESRRFRLHARTRSPVMPGMSFLVASVIVLQQPVVVVPPMPPVASVLEAVRAARAVASVVLPDVTSLQGLESLTQDEQDPTDSLWRAAHQALNREERSEEHTSEIQSPYDLVCRLRPEKKKTMNRRSNKPE